MKIALHTDWLTVRGGAEKVIIDFIKIFPEADIFTTVFKPENFPELKDYKFVGIQENVNIETNGNKSLQDNGKPRIFTSYLQKLPKFLRKHTLLMPFYPKAIENFDFSEYDLIIGSSSNATKGILTNPENTYICYCHTPVRALWSDHRMFSTDPRYKFIPNFLLDGVLHKLRIKDYCAAQRVDYFLANSQYIGKRIKKFYGKDSKVIYPNCQIEIDKNYKKEKGEYFVSISRFVPAKKNDLLIEAFKKMPNKKLKLYGFGTELERLIKLSQGFDNIEIIEWSGDKAKKGEREKIMCKSIAFLHPQKEDFGITAIEAQSFGVPVIAYGEGGIKETVIEGKTGILFKNQTSEDLIDAIENFNEDDFKTEDLVKNAKKFSFERFKKEILEFIDSTNKLKK